MVITIIIIIVVIIILMIITLRNTPLPKVATGALPAGRRGCPGEPGAGSRFDIDLNTIVDVYDMYIYIYTH